jgi:hypothetical protein
MQEMYKIGKGASGWLDRDDPTDRLPAPLNNELFALIVYAIEKRRKRYERPALPRCAISSESDCQILARTQGTLKGLPFWSKCTTPQNSSN